MSADWDALLALFEGALERPKEERAVFLDEHTKGDAALRREVESLLASHDGAGGFLSTPALGPRLEPPDDPGQPGRSASGPTRLTAGTSLGAFTILEPLGAGGMGEVYRARDVRLDRLVAIKVLSSERATAPGGRERFEREARAISRLSHPRICTVHEVGVADISGSDVQYLVMELLDGETLAARIARGPLSIEQSLAYAIDIADGLIAAHAQGIVHRDLKPANVMLTSTGVKLLDFGLAQLRAPVPAGVSVPAVSSVSGLSSEGLVFGTLPYTSPEQLRGEKVDTRTDIFAFGAVLYEMLTGERPFVADSQAGLIAAILEHDAPPVSELQTLAPAGLDRVVRKCLAKHPDDRWQTARDLKSELHWLRDGRDNTHRRGATGRRSRRWLQALLTVVPAVAAAILAVLLWNAGASKAPPPRQVTRLSLNFPPGVTLHIPVNGMSLAIAPDGSRVAFIGARDGRTTVFVHTLETGSTLEVPDTGDAAYPMFSPDSQWVAFVKQTGIDKVPAAGGQAQRVWNGRGQLTTWLSDGRIVRGGLRTPIRHLGETVSDITVIRDDEEGHQTPVLLPGGSMLFTILRAGFLSDLNSVAVWRPGARESQDVIRNATTPQLVGADAIVYARGRSLIAAGFDSRALRVTGEPRALLDLQTTLASAAPMYALAGNGTLVCAEPARGRRLVWIDREGREEFVKADERMYSHLRLSPDGTRVATSVNDENRDLWILRVDGSAVQKLTDGPARDNMPVWSPDGSHIFFSTADRNISRIPADRATDPVRLLQLEKPERIFPLAITPDGKTLLTNWEPNQNQDHLRLVDLGPPVAARSVVGESGTENDARLSPDGRWLAYDSAESIGERNRGQIKVRPFPEVTSGLWVISPGVGRQPVWSHDGRELFYRTEDGTVMSVPVRTSPTFSPGRPRPLFTPRDVLSHPQTGPAYDVSRDGQRFLFIKAPDLDIRSLTVILNWDVEVQTAIGGQR